MKLDLDALLAPPLELTLGGKVYQIAQMKMRDYVATIPLQEALREADGLEAQLNATKELLAKLAPGLPKEAIDDLTTGQLSKLVLELSRFQSGTGDEGNPKGAGAAVN